MTATKTATDIPAGVAENAPGNGTEAAADAPEATFGSDTRPTPERMGGAVWYALNDHPGTNAATLAATAGVGKAAARRALNELEKAGYAARTPGGRVGGKRAADTWQATPTGITTDPGPAEAAPDAPADTGTAEPAPATDETPTTTSPARPAYEAPDLTGGTAPGEHTDTSDISGEADAPAGRGEEVTEPDRDGEAAAEAMDEAAVAQARAAVSVLAADIEAASAALSAGDRAAALEAAEVIYGDSAKVRRLIKNAIRPRTRSGSGKPHAHPGELRDKVAAHLATHPGLQLTPHEVGRAIGHSAGAVANALDKLTETGQAVLTCERPRRFTAAEGAGDAAPSTATAAATA